MAAYSPLDYGAAIGLGRAAVPDIAGMMERGQDRAISQANTQLQREQFDTKQQRLLQYQAELAELNKVPPEQKAAATAAFMARWPEFANEMKSSFDLSKAAGREAEITRLGGIHQALTGKKYDTALKLLEERAAADAAAQRPEDPIAKGIIDALKSGDAARISEAQTAIETMMYAALGDEKYVEKVAGGSKPTAFEQNLELVEKKYGPEAAKAYAIKPQYGYDTAGNLIEIPAGSVPRLGGGTPAPAPQAQTFEAGGVSGTINPPDATGLKTLTSDKWQPGTSVYVVHSEQEFQKVPPGAFFVAPDGNMRRKPGGS